MEKLFGMPINDFMVALLIIFGVFALVAGAIGLRNRVVVKMAVRNLPRRRSQTALIILGLMLATVLFSAAFATGDTMAHSIRLIAVERLGEVDVIVAGDSRDASGRQIYFDAGTLETVREHLAGDEAVAGLVAGVAPLVRETAPVVAPESRQSEPDIQVLGYDESQMAGFDKLIDGNGEPLSLVKLRPGEVYVSAKAAEALDAGPGDPLEVYVGQQPISVVVAAVYESGGTPAGRSSIALPLSRLQAALGEEGQLNNVLVTNVGGPTEGGEHVNAVEESLGTYLKNTPLKAFPDKKDALDQAEEVGSEFLTVFLVFGQFSIMAGILLIFLIFVMLAAERKRELGIARAVGAQRGHVIRLFTYEGIVYALIAAAIGSLLGVGVGLGMVFMIGAALSEQDFDVVFFFNWRSVVIAYTMGMVLTFAVVIVSSWRVSRLNIVAAIRDLQVPMPVQVKSWRDIGRDPWHALVRPFALVWRSVRALASLHPIDAILSILLAAWAVVVFPVVLARSVAVALLRLLARGWLTAPLGALLAIVGYQGGQLAQWMLGTSLVIIGVPLLARRVGLPNRAAFTVAGLGLMVWWLLPFDTLDSILPDFEQGIEMFFLSGIMIVLGAVWTTIYNSDVLLAATTAVLGRVQGLTPVLKTAVSYPMESRLRTGMALTMFSLILFALTVMGFVISGTDAILEDPERISGGFHVRANTSGINPISDISAAIDEAEDVEIGDFEAISSFSFDRLELKQDGTENEAVDWWVRAVDTSYTDTVTHKFAVTAPGYDTAGEVWEALQDEPGTAVVDYSLAPTRNDFDVGGSGPDLKLEGFFLEDEALHEVHLLATDPRSGNEQKLRVIGVLKDGSGYVSGVMTSQATLDGLVSEHISPRSFLFRLKDGVDASATAKAMEASFFENGMQAVVISEEIIDEAAIERTFNLLLQGFMGLGLVVGIAALGVIAARAVVERRQQIGMLRALGFQKEMVQLSFLIESSFIALLGILLGVVLGSILSYNLIQEVGKEIEGLVYRPPWVNMAAVVVIAYIASLLTTYLPARQASKVYPADALRAE